MSIIFLVLTAYFFIRYCSARFNSTAYVARQVKEIADTRKNEIINFLQEQRNQSAHVAGNEQVVRSFVALSKLFDPKKDSPEYKKEEIELDQFFNGYKATYNFRDIIFIDHQGALFYTTKIDVFGEKNIFKGDYAGGPVSKSFERVRMTLTPDITDFSISKLANEPAFYIVQPVFSEENFIGAIAVWVDEAALYKIIQNYTGLGETGDIFAMKAVEDRALFVAPSRLYDNVAFKKISPPDKYALTPGRKAALGYEGNGTIIDTFGIPIIAAWVFVPQLNIGLAVGVQLSEVLESAQRFMFYFNITLALFLLVVIIYLFSIRRVPFMRSWYSVIFGRRMLRIFLWCVFLIMAFISSWLVWSYKNRYNQILQNTLVSARATINAEVILINQYLKEVSSIAEMIAKDLQMGALKKEDIGLRINKDVKELRGISSISVAYAPFAYDSQKRLFVIQAQRAGDTITVTTPEDDYMIPASDDKPQDGWYDKAIKKNSSFWSEPFLDQATKKSSILYALPFYSTVGSEPAGVIGIVYQLDKIIDHARSIEVGKTGYGLILSDKNQFIYHPVEQLVKEKIGLLEITREKNNQDLKNIADKILARKSGTGTFSERVSGLQYWLVYEPIPSIPWNMAVLFSSAALDLPVNKMHQQRIVIFIFVVLTLLLGTMLISHLEFLTRDHLRVWAVLTVLLFASSIGTFWFLLRKTSYEPRPEITVVRDQANVDKFIEFLDYDAVQRDEKRPIVVPTGIILHTVSFATSNKVTISGYAWQKIKKDISVIEGIRFPEAADFTMKEVLRKKDGNETLIGWNIIVTFLQKHRFSWFPFDRVHVDITLASSDFEKNVILVPDFASYQSLEIDPLPGITNQLNVPGFELERSFFSFSALPAYNEVGLEIVRDVTENIQMHYNLILTRKLTNPFIIFFLPLLIILFTIFAVFLLSYKGHFKTDSFKTLSAYTAVFFSLVILHQTLRTQYQAGELLYIEYFFFFAYLSLFILILHALLIRVSKFRFFIDRKISPYVSILFWPIQFALWFIVTMMVFYVVR